MPSSELSAIECQVAASTILSVDVCIIEREKITPDTHTTRHRDGRCSAPHSGTYRLDRIFKVLPSILEQCVMKRLWYVTMCRHNMLRAKKLDSAIFFVIQSSFGCCRHGAVLCIPARRLFQLFEQRGLHLLEGALGLCVATPNHRQICIARCDILCRKDHFQRLS